MDNNIKFIVGNVDEAVSIMRQAAKWLMDADTSGGSSLVDHCEHAQCGTYVVCYAHLI